MFEPILFPFYFAAVCSVVSLANSEVVQARGDACKNSVFESVVMITPGAERAVQDEVAAAFEA